MSAIYEFKATGVSPLLMHADNFTRMRQVEAWRNAPANREVSVAGDDRSPAWTWIAYLYEANDRLVIPSTSLMACLRKAGAQVTLKGKKTCKDASQYGILPVEEAFAFTNHGKPVETAPLQSLWGDNDFDKHCEKAVESGFDLLAIRAAVGTKKHVRVRPRLSSWSFSGTFHVTVPELTPSVIADIFSVAGERVGIGDWRPSAPKSPGPYGRFTADLKQVG